MKQRTTVAAMLGGGIAIGWIMGLSVSPVTQTILGALVTVVAGAAAVFAGIRPASPEKPPAPESAQPMGETAGRPRTDVLPIAALLVGAALGASSGIWVRTHNLLSPSPEAQVSEWSAASGLPKAQIALALLGARPSGGGSGGSIPLAITGLFDVPADACREVAGALRTDDTAALSKALQAWWPSIRRALDGQAPDPRLLQVLSKVVCP